MIIKPLGLPWVTSDPFLFCMYHKDAYPAGNDKLGPAASLAGRNIGQDSAGRTTEISVAAPAPPKSWAAHADAHVAIWTIKMAPNAQWAMPAAEAGVTRTIYFFSGSRLQIQDRVLDRHCAVELDPSPLTF